MANLGILAASVKVPLQIFSCSIFARAESITLSSFPYLNLLLLVVKYFVLSLTETFEVTVVFVDLMREEASQ